MSRGQLMPVANLWRVAVWVYFETKKMSHSTDNFSDLRHMYCYLWQLRSNQIMISNCPNVGTVFTHGI